MLNAPDSLLTTVVCTLVCVFVAVMVTPGIRAFDASSTVPVSTLFPTWAHSGDTATHKTITTLKNLCMANSPCRRRWGKRRHSATIRLDKREKVCGTEFRREYINSQRLVKKLLQFGGKHPLVRARPTVSVGRGVAVHLY